MKMHNCMILLVLLSLVCALSIVEGSLSDRLRHFEVLQASQLKPKRVRRSVGDSHVDLEEFDFKALGRRFHMRLRQMSVMPVLLPGFEATAIDGNGKKTPISLDMSGFYEGKLSDDKDSSVRALMDDGVLNAVIDTDNDTIVIEPARPYIPNAANDSSIIYRGSNLLPPPKKHLCGSVRLNDSVAVPTSNSDDEKTLKTEHGQRRKKRSADERNTCPLLLIADYLFFKKVAQEDKGKATRKLIALIDRINRIYRRTKFTDAKRNSLTNFGFGIMHIRVHTECKRDDASHFNKCTAEEPDVWEDRKLLSAFDRDDYADYCLAHLFTYQRFSSGTLGLAYIGSDRYGALGGICSPQQDCMRSTKCSINTGWTTFQDSSGSTLITLESHLVTAHELGHNMGSSHDPDTAECSPPAERDGKYLMYQYSVNGYERNNHFFSPCSRRSIGRALATKAPKCFMKMSHSFCGNNRREGNEECDAGLAGLTNDDKCCAQNCKLKKGAKCSPSNDACCNALCKPESAGSLCARSDLTSPCEGNAYCDGTNGHCPLPTSLDDTSCGDFGTCKNRTCRPFCEGVGLIPCLCDEVKDSCRVCCRKVNDTCRPYEGKPLVLKNGRPCIQGVCRDGRCKRQIHNSVERLWIIIKYFNVNEIGRIMWANVVGTVIMLSLIVWIPLSCFISYYDRVLADPNREISSAYRA